MICTDVDRQEAVDAFIEDPLNCIEKLMLSSGHRRVADIRALWEARSITTDEMNRLLREEAGKALKTAVSEILQDSWASNDVRETSQQCRDSWLERWVNYICGDEATP